MVTAEALDPPDVVVKKYVPDELDDSVTVAAAFVFVTTLPKLSWAWTWKGPTLAEEVTAWLPLTVEVNTSFVGVDATTLNEFVVAEVTVACVESDAVML
jgi:hypothetical protein